MIKKRLIPCLFLKNGFIVRSEKFRIHQYLGNAINQVERFNSWNVDELIYIDISEDSIYDIRRDDLKVKCENNIYELISAISKTCFMPLTFGGGIRTIDDIAQRLRRGADKVPINTKALESPDFIGESAAKFGSQCIIVSVDVVKHDNGIYEVFSKHGKIPTGMSPVWWAKDVERLGAGEIFLNSVDRDGTGQGYDLELIRSVADAVTIPVIACGGVGRFSDFADGIIQGNADAVSAGNIFHFTELSVKQARKHLIKAGVNVRLI